jgi:hypothetical protein
MLVLLEIFILLNIWLSLVVVVVENNLVEEVVREDILAPLQMLSLAQHIQLLLEQAELESQLMVLALMVIHHQDLEHQQQAAVEAEEVAQLMVLLVVLVVAVLEKQVVELVVQEVLVHLVKAMLEVQVFLLF